MFFLYIQILDISYKEDVILGLQSVGISRASVVESKNLESELSNEMSLFHGFFRSAEERKNEQLIIHAVIENKNQARALVDNLREGGIGLEKEDIIRLTLLPITMTYDSAGGFREY